MLIPKADRKAIHEVRRHPIPQQPKTDSAIRNSKKRNDIENLVHTATPTFAMIAMTPRIRKDTASVMLHSAAAGMDSWLTFQYDRPSSVRESSWLRRSKDHHMETSNTTGPGLTTRLVQLQPRAAPRDPRQEPLRHQGHAVPEQPWPGQDSVLLAVLWVPPTERAVDILGSRRGAMRIWD